MSEMNGFKRRVFGGFDRRDVVKYIEELASERNALLKENEKLRGELDGIEEVQSASKPAVADACEILSSLEKEYSILCADVEVSAAHLKCESEAAGKRMASVTELLKDTGERISHLRQELEQEGE